MGCGGSKVTEDKKKCDKPCDKGEEKDKKCEDVKCEDKKECKNSEPEMSKKEKKKIKKKRKKADKSNSSYESYSSYEKSDDERKHNDSKHS
jgi:hypothetical protein